jgi:hypothetical protein
MVPLQSLCVLPSYKQRKYPSGFRFCWFKAFSVAKYNGVAIFHNLSQKRLRLGIAQ